MVRAAITVCVRVRVCGRGSFTNLYINNYIHYIVLFLYYITQSIVCTVCIF